MAQQSQVLFASNSSTEELGGSRPSSVRPEDSASNVVPTPSRKRARKSLEERIERMVADLEKPDADADENDLFGSMIAKLIKKLPVYAQLDAQQEIMGVAHRIVAQYNPAPPSSFLTASDDGSVFQNI